MIKRQRDLDPDEVEACEFDKEALLWWESEIDAPRNGAFQHLHAKYRHELGQLDGNENGALLCTFVEAYMIGLRSADPAQFLERGMLLDDVDESVLTPAVKRLADGLEDVYLQPTPLPMHSFIVDFYEMMVGAVDLDVTDVWEGCKWGKANRAKTKLGAKYEVAPEDSDSDE